MNPQDSIRQATLEDVGGIAQMLVHVQKLHADAEPMLFKQPTSPDPFASEIQERMQNDSHIYLVAEEEEQIVGYLLAVIIQRPETIYQFARSWLEIDQISVEPAHQHQGWGAALIEQAKQIAQEKSLSQVTLSTWEFNTKAQQFFRKQGFTPYLHWMRVEIEQKGER